MSISAIGQTHPSITLNKLYSNTSASNTEVSTTSKNEDTVSISAQGQSASQTHTPPELYAMRIPDWYAETLSPATIFNSDAIHETRKSMEIFERSNADGVITKKEQKAIDSYKDNMVATKAMRAQFSFQASHGSELTEYGKIKEDALNEVIDSLGIDRKTAMTADYSDSDEVGRRFKELLSENPRVSELEKILGVGDKKFFYNK